MAAATLSAQVGTPTGDRKATLYVESDQATGTVYGVLTGSITTPTHAQILAGTDDNDDPARWAGSAAAAATNTLLATEVPRVPGALYAHFTQVNGGAEASTPKTASGFWLHGMGYGTFSADGTSSIVIMRRPAISAIGTFGGGTVTFYVQDGDGTWTAISGAAYTADGQTVLDYERPVAVKCVLSGATLPAIKWHFR